MLLNNLSCIYFIFLDEYVEKEQCIPQKGYKYVSQIVLNLGFQTPCLLPSLPRTSEHL